MWKLVIEDDEGKRTVVPLSRDDYTIGRQEGNTIRLTERNVSRHHGRVRRQRAGTNGSAPDVLTVEDCQSYNGVFVNGLRVATAQDLQHGDLIQIGDYRIVIQDDAASSIEADVPVAAVEPDPKSTVPMATAYRGSLLTERPNRLVMLVGPTPGVEYPLDRERMTIGRAEDATISVNHNSVSRLHCEIHAFGDGRFEIVDKGSSNGVRVNAVELRRSIIEAGDTIELGDVRFKFVGAGQVFVPGPNESQQLTAISDREAELASPPRRGLGGYLAPILGAGVVGAGVILAFVYVLRARASTGEASPTTAAPDAEQALVLDAKRACTIEDCEAAHQTVSALPQSSIWRSSPDYRQIETTWAASLLRRAEVEQDVETRRTLLNRVVQAPGVDQVQRQGALDQLALLDKPLAVAPQPPALATRERVAQPAATPAHAPRATPANPSPTPTTARKPEPTSHPTLTSGTTTSPAPPRPSSGTSATERARQAILDGKPWEARQILEAKGVRTGHGSADDVNMLRKLCASPPDAACLDDLRRNYNR